MKIKVGVLVVLAIASVLVSILIGSVAIPFETVLKVVYNNVISNVYEVESVMNTLVWEIRIPRILTAFFVGGALAMSGAVMQSLLGNPLASTYTLGVSSGASLGVAIVIVLGLSFGVAYSVVVSFFGFLFAFLTMIIVLFVTKAIDKAMSNYTILLVGFIVSIFLNSIVTSIGAIFKDDYQKIINFQMGSFAGKSYMELGIIVIVTIVGIVLLYRMSTELDVLSFGEEQAKTLGINVKRTKTLLIVITTVLTGVAVSIAGAIGFVDLISPHIVRRVYGVSSKVLVSLSFLVGGTMMVVADTIARTIISPSELAVGVVTSLVGAPFFVIIFFVSKKKVQ